MDLTLNNLQRLICHKTNKPNQTNLLFSLYDLLEQRNSLDVIFFLLINVNEHLWQRFPLYFKITENFMNLIFSDRFWFVPLQFGCMTDFNVLHNSR